MEISNWQPFKTGHLIHKEMMMILTNLISQNKLSVNKCLYRFYGLSAHQNWIRRREKKAQHLEEKSFFRNNAYWKGCLDFFLFHAFTVHTIVKRVCDSSVRNVQPPTSCLGRLGIKLMKEILHKKLNIVKLW